MQRFVQNPRVRTISSLLLACFILVPAAYLIASVTNNSERSADPKRGNASWSLTTLKGDDFSPEQLMGQVDLIVFSKGFECAHCATQIQKLEKSFAEFEKRQIRIHVVVSDSEASLRKAVGADEWSFDFVADPEQKAFSEYHCSGQNPLHGVFLIDEQGNVRWSQTGDQPFFEFNVILAQSAKVTNFAGENVSTSTTAGKREQDSGTSPDDKVTGKSGITYQPLGKGTRWIYKKDVFLKMLVEGSTYGTGEVEVAELYIPKLPKEDQEIQGWEHIHKSTEIFYVVSGRMGHTVNGKKHIIEPGQVGIVHGGDKVIHTVEGDEPVKAIVIWLPGGEGDRLIEGKNFKQAEIGSLLAK